MKMIWSEIWMERSVVCVCVVGGMKTPDEACPNLTYRGNLPEPTRQCQPSKS